MATWPCAVCDQRFAGPAMSLYLTLYEGDEAEKYRFVCCPICAKALLDPWRKRALFRNNDGEWEFPPLDGEPTPHKIPLEGPPGPRKRR